MKHRLQYNKEKEMEARIKLTKRMLTKSIMDANKTVQALADEIDYSYNNIANGDKVVIDALYEDDTPTEVRLYRRPRGDRLLSVKNLRKFASEGDTLGLRPEVVVTDDMTFEIRVLVYKVDDDETNAA
tara:strand:- start:447 stop:830 length:384 start_codon:yes stop_codon:yes gene_type:complete